MDNKHLKEVCKIGQGEATCRYIVCSVDGFGCAKNTNIKRVLDIRVEENAMTAKGDNCPGIVVAKNI